MGRFALGLSAQKSQRSRNHTTEFFENYRFYIEEKTSDNAIYVAYDKTAINGYVENSSCQMRLAIKNRLADIPFRSVHIH